MNSSRYSEAIDNLNKYVSANPQDAEGFKLRGICYEKQGNYEFAVYDLRTAQKISPADSGIKVILNRIEQDWYKHLYNKIEGYKREIAINPSVPENYLEIGKAYKNLGEWKEAEIWYDIYLSMKEASSDEIIRYSEILAKNNQISKGSKILKKYVDRFPEDHRLWSRYGYFNYWLGNTKIAKESFKTALQIRPFFKDAMDGLDLVEGRGYVYSTNDTSVYYNYGMPAPKKVYAIDSYYRKLKRNPDDDATRYKLINELLKANRFEEAAQQLDLFSINEKQTKKWADISDNVNTLKTKYYDNEINTLLASLQKNPDNLKALEKLAEFYSLKKDYGTASVYLNKYLNLDPDNSKVRYKLAQLYLWQSDYCSALIETDKLLKKDPENVDYQLLGAKLRLWLNKDYDKAEELFSSVLKKDEHNVDAILGLVSLKIQNQKFADAENLLDNSLSYSEIFNKYPAETKRYNELKNNIETGKQFSLLEKARNLVLDKNYSAAIKNYNKYLFGKNAELSIYNELAELYLLDNNYYSAVRMLDSSLARSYDYELDKKRAKILFWNGDSLSAFNEFRRLSNAKPEDIEARLFLGDSYFKLKQYQSARSIYENLYESYPGSHIIKTRLMWLDGGNYYYAGFPTYIQIKPQAYLFTDNTDFTLSSYGVGVDAGITDFLTLGISGNGGLLSSDIINLNYLQLRANAYFKLSDIVNTSVSFGNISLPDNINRTSSDVYFNASEKNKYSVSGFFNYTDAAFLLYSPFLVGTRLNAFQAGFDGKYIFRNKFLLSGRYAYIDVSDDNTANQVTLKFGKQFIDKIELGYEYYFYSFKDSTYLYWSPKNFESHSLWIDFIIYKDAEVSFSAGGKAGYIPNDDFVLFDVYGAFGYYFTNNLLLQLRGGTGSTSRAGVGYRSVFFQAGIYWMI